MAGDFKIRNIYLVFLAIYRIKNWITYFLDLFNLSNEQTIIYKMRDGLRYCVKANTTDRGIMNTVAVQDQYQLKKMDLNDSIIIDIGGQKGYFSIFASKWAKQIYTFEPVPENFNMILKNIELNKLTEKIHPFNLAVSNDRKNLKIFLSKGNTGGHSMYGSGNDFIEVKSTTLPEIFEKNDIKQCKLLKMDAEGAEWGILYNLPDNYFERILNIRMEVHNIDNNRNNREALIKFLKEKNYQITVDQMILFAQRIPNK